MAIGRTLSARRAFGTPLDAVRIGHLDGDLRDPRCTWARDRGITPEGALLIRPARFVAWRSIGGTGAEWARMQKARDFCGATAVCSPLQGTGGRPWQNATSSTSA